MPRPEQRRLHARMGVQLDDTITDQQFVAFKAYIRGEHGVTKVRLLDAATQPSTVIEHLCENGRIVIGDADGYKELVEAFESIGAPPLAKIVQDFQRQVNEAGVDTMPTAAAEPTKQQSKPDQMIPSEKISEIFMAVVCGDIEKLHGFVKDGVGLNTKNNQSGNTLLHAAVEVEEPEVVAYLISAGADTNVVDKDGRTPLTAARSRNQTEMINLLKENGVRI